MRRRQRRVARTPLQATLELSDSNLETLVRPNQTPVRHHQVVEPKQHLSLPDRLSLDDLDLVHPAGSDRFQDADREQSIDAAEANA